MKLSLFLVSMAVLQVRYLPSEELGLASFLPAIIFGLATHTLWNRKTLWLSITGISATVILSLYLLSLFTNHFLYPYIPWVVAGTICLQMMPNFKKFKLSLWEWCALALLILPFGPFQPAGILSAIILICYFLGQDMAAGRNVFAVIIITAAIPYALLLDFSGAGWDYYLVFSKFVVNIFLLRPGGANV